MVFLNFILLIFFCKGTAQAAIFDLTLFKETYEESRKAFLSVAGDKAHTFVFKKIKIMSSLLIMFICQLAQPTRPLS